MSGVLQQLRTQFADRLQADSYFLDIPVFTEEKADLDNEIARSLGVLTETGGKIGACAVVLSPRADVKDKGLPGPYLDPIRLAVHVEESVLINQSTSGTGKHASDIAERISALIHRWVPDGQSRPVLADNPHIQAVEPAIGDRAYSVAFSFAAGLSVSLSTVATPVAVPASGAAPQTVALTCATGGAAIFYTLTGAFPSPTAGTLYTAAVSVPTACTLRAKAYLAGYLASAELTIVFT
jgi:hypothetical protein